MDLRGLATIEVPTPGAASEPELIPRRSFILSAELAARLVAHCAAVGDHPADFIADAIELALDADDLVEEGTL